jgi:hypothetical protein
MNIVNTSIYIFEIFRHLICLEKWHHGSIYKVWDW